MVDFPGAKFSRLARNFIGMAFNKILWSIRTQSVKTSKKNLVNQVVSENNIESAEIVTKLLSLQNAAAFINLSTVFDSHKIIICL